MRASNVLFTSFLSLVASTNLAIAYELPFYIYGKSKVSNNLDATVSGIYKYSIDGPYATRTIKDTDVTLGLTDYSYLYSSIRTPLTSYTSLPKASTYYNIDTHYTSLDFGTSAHPSINAAITYSPAVSPLQNKPASIADGTLHAQLSGIKGFSDFQSLIIIPGTKRDALEDIVKGGLNLYTQGPKLLGEFKPRYSLSLADVAAIGGFTSLNWTQQITHYPLPHNVSSNNDPGVPLKLPFSDPPPGGYFDYDANYAADAYPFYFDQAYLDRFSGIDYLDFEDTPGSNCLVGGSGEGCEGIVNPPGSYIGLTTDLVGVLPGNKVGKTLIEFKWVTDYNRSDLGGGPVVFGNIGSYSGGTGGPKILSVTYFPGDNVTTVPLPSSLMMMIWGLILLTLCHMLINAPFGKFRQG